MSTAHVPSPTAQQEVQSGPDAGAHKPGLAHRLYTGDVSWDFIGHRKLFFTISGVLLGISLLALLLSGLKLGIEFKGGADFSAPVSVNAQTVDTVRAAVQASK